MQAVKSSFLASRGSVRVRALEGETMTPPKLSDYIDKTITLLCQRHIYTGRVVSVSNFYIELAEAKVDLQPDDGMFDAADFKAELNLPRQSWFVAIDKVEGFG